MDADRGAAEGPKVNVANRARERRLAVGIVIISFLVLLLLLGNLTIGRMLYDGAEWYSNTEINPFVRSAYPVGANITAVIYIKDGGDMPYLRSGNDVYVAFMDEHGQYTCPQTFLPDVWIIGETSGHDEEIAAVHGTASGITIFCRPRDYYVQSPPTLRCISVDAFTGVASPSVEPMPGLNLSGNEFKSVQWGDVIHALVWRQYDWEPPQNGSVVYTRSMDGGRTWQDPLTLLGANVSVTWACFSARGDMVSALLFGIHDPARGWNGNVDLLVQSTDGGASFEAPVKLTGDTITESPYSSDIAQGSDGTILLITRIYTEGTIRSEISTVNSTGIVNRIALPVSSTRQLELLVDEGHPQSYRADVFGIRFYDSSKQTTRLDTYSIDGDLLDSITSTVRQSGAHHVHIIYTRAGDGYREGITTRNVIVTHSDVLKRATEILLVREDTDTGELSTIGMPYDVVFMHTEAEKAAYAERTSPVVAAAWISLLVLLVVGLLATRLSTRAPERDEMVSWVKVLLLAMVVLMPACMAVGLYVDEHDLYWHPHPNLYGLAFVIAGVCMVEMRARISQKVPPPRMLHVPFAVLGVLLVSFYPGVGFIASEWSVVLLIGLTMLVWPVLLFLSVSIPFRFHAQMAPGDERFLHIALSISLLTMAIISLFFPFFVFIGSFHTIP